MSARLLGLLIDLWAAFFVAPSTVQYLPNQAAKFVGNYRNGVLVSFGTEFKVMQELLRHSTLRSTLDVYTQAITPAKHAAPAAVLSLVFSHEATGTSLSASSASAAA